MAAYHGRQIAKIAFNFLANRTSGQFALREEFDDIRGYIRRGIMPRFVPVTIVKVSPVGEDDGISRRTGRHEIVLSTNEVGEVVCRVNLFSHLTYQVVLSQGSFLWYPLEDGRYLIWEVCTLEGFRKEGERRRDREKVDHV
jgi:hypothetical protein